MEFNKRYNRTEFIRFIDKFLPEDFVAKTQEIEPKTQNALICSVSKLGTCNSLDLVVYEIRHNSKNDPRVGLTKAAFRFLANEWVDRALVAFVPADNDSNYRLSLITIDLDENEKGKTVKSYSNPRRYSYFLGEDIACYTPNKYLNEKGRVTDYEDLKSRFSVEVLTKAFYQELSDWYAWAVKEIRFPNKLNDSSDDDKYNNESAIRLVTRLIFVWFLKQKHLIPEEFFNEKYIADNLIKDFDPNKSVDMYGNKSLESKYYKAILQNLFFAMLNSPITKEGGTEITERRFRDNRGDYDNNKLMRYESYFKNPQLFVDLANRTVPFLNGGLFDCLDEKDRGLYYDCFTDRREVNKYLIAPDYLFFGEEGKYIDLSDYYQDKKKKKVPANGILDILKQYNFTVEENTPFDQEVSLDPELLGKVFENLLASYNPETQTTARKQTGSFYTPREIVQYMVDESLVAHLKRIVGEEYEAEYRKLISYADEEVCLSDNQKQQVIEAIYHCKVLDPACGSGAFPVGMLQQMVHILSQLDPKNKQWQKLVLDEAVNESRDALMAETLEEREERQRDINNSFDERLNHPDYARKLYLIENCIYGVDIQPIAIQISKLRFFISLVVDQKTNNDPVQNFGIRPLPNLEAKFVAANTLIPINNFNGELGRTPEVIAIENKLKEANHKIFSARTRRTKKRWKERVIELRQELAERLVSDGFLTNDAANQVTSWDMFDQNASASFFDADWMFGVKDGFDIVIGNPPYVLLQNTSIPSEIKQYYIETYSVAQYKVDLYHLFYEKGISLLNHKGIMSFITPISFLKNKYNDRLRCKLVSETKIISIIRFFIPVFDASVDNAILVCSKDRTSNNAIHYFDIRCNFTEISNMKARGKIQQETIVAPKYNFEIDIDINNSVIKKMESKSQLKSYAKSYFGIQTYDRKIYVSDHKVNKNYQPIIDGANVHPYYYLPSHEFVCFTKDAIKSGGNTKIYKQDRIVVRQIGAYPEGCICPAGLCTLNTIYNIYLLNNKLSLEYLLGLINSKLLHYYWMLKYNDSKKTFPKIKKEPLESIPIVEPLDKVSDDKIASIVNDIIAMKSENSEVDVSLKVQKIDSIVYHLYGLTYEEVLIVDPETPITREEYK